MKKWLFSLILAAILLPAAFFAGYVGHEKRVFPIRPFVKRVLIELGTPEPAISIFRKDQLPLTYLFSSILNIETAYYKFHGKVYDLPTSYSYGGIETFEDELIFVGGKGEIWQFSNERFIKIHTHRIPLSHRVKNEDDVNQSDNFTFIKDIKIIDNFLYASATEYYFSKECTTLSLFRIGIYLKDGKIFTSGNWEKLFNTIPCLKENEPNGSNVRQSEAGGRIIRLSESKLLMSVGHFGLDGVNGMPHAQDLSSHYGKILEIDTTTFNATIYSFGHRNPQGLIISNKGVVYSTEHGPQGGDELNIIVKGRNYGWPLVTYGTQYNEKTWPLDRTRKDHSGFEKPVYAWLPSIATSELIQINNDKLPLWDGDLLVSSLFKASLFRIKMEGERPIIVEPIYVGSRIRDIVNWKYGFALQIDGENRLIIMEPVELASLPPPCLNLARNGSDDEDTSAPDLRADPDRC